jgi:hypothetical protein
MLLGIAGFLLSHLRHRKNASFRALRSAHFVFDGAQTDFESTLTINERKLSAKALVDSVSVATRATGKG